MMYALVCVTLRRRTHASIEYSPVAWIIEAIFWLALVEACALPPSRS